jgi:serine/threonine protein kinase
MIGETIGQYQVENEIGRGAMGVVYKGRDLKLDRPVAMKFLPFTGQDARKQIDRLIREARTLAAVEHPNICPIFNVIETEDSACLVMAFVEGESLQARLDRLGPMPWAEAVKIILQAARGLSAAHQRGIIHRDIKPDNLMLTNENRVLVMDFGVARRQDATLQTVQGTLTGTAPYMAPEQWRGDSVDGRTDVWGLGVVLYQLITGKQPFSGEFPEAVMYSVLNSDPAPLSGLAPEPVEDVLKKALEKEGSRRYQSCQEFAQDLEALLNESQPATARRKGRSRIPLLAVAALVLACLGIWQFGPWRADRIQPPLPATRVLVVPFDNQTGDPSLDNLGQLAAGTYADKLTEIEELDVVPPSAIEATGMGTEIAQLPHLAQALGAGTLVTGAYFLSGNDLVVQANVTGENPAQWRFSVPRTSAKRDIPLTAFEESLDRILGGLLMTVANPYREPVGRAPKYEAARAYLTGLELYPTNRATSYILRAASIDTNFLGPQILIAEHLGDPEHPLVQKVMASIESRLSSFSPFEKARIESVQHLLQTNFEGAFAAARRAHDLEPRDLLAATRLISCAHNTNRPHIGLAVYRDLDLPESLVNHWGLESLGRMALMMLEWTGDHEAMLDEARSLIARFPQSNRLFAYEMQALGRLGRYAEMDSVAAALIGRTGGIGDIPYVLEHGMRVLAIQEEFGWARRIADRGIAWIGTQDPDYRKQGAFYTAHMLQHCNRWDAVDSLYTAEGWNTPEDVEDSHLLTSRILARAEAHLGNDDWALKICDIFNQQEKFKDQAQYQARAHYEKACVLGILGQKEEAVHLLREAYRQGWFRSEYVDPDPSFNSIKGFAPFEELMKAKG